jgi:hypothetical protein
MLLCTLGLTSCATGPKKAGKGPSIYKESKAPPPSSVSVAVEKFSTKNYVILPSAAKGLADFEAIYLPTRLVRALKQQPGISEAYFTMGETSATDFVVKGSVLKSDGRKQKIQLALHRVDGATVWKKNFSYSIASGTDAVINSTVGSFWAKAAKSVSDSRQKTKINLAEARAVAYAGNPNIIPTEQVLGDADIAGELERTQILAELTDHLLPRADAASQYYRSWQQESMHFLKGRDKAKRQKASANFGQGLAIMAAGASAYAGGYAVAQGDTYNAQLAQTNITQATMLAENASANAAVASNKIKQLEEQLQILKSDFAIGTGREITVTIYGQIVTLHGSQMEMMKQFREVVRNKLTEAGSAPEAALAVIDAEISLLSAG